MSDTAPTPDIEHDPLTAELEFFGTYVALMERYRATKANRRDDPAAYEAAAAELAEWRRDIRILSGRVGIETATAGREG